MVAWWWCFCFKYGRIDAAVKCIVVDLKSTVYVGIPPSIVDSLSIWSDKELIRVSIRATPAAATNFAAVALFHVSFESKAAPLVKHDAGTVPLDMPAAIKEDEGDQDDASHDAEGHDNADPGLVGEHGVVQVGVIVAVIRHAVGGWDSIPRCAEDKKEESRKSQLNRQAVQPSRPSKSDMLNVGCWIRVLSNRQTLPM